jgi:hypothetical protein
MSNVECRMVLVSLVMALWLVGASPLAAQTNQERALELLRAAKSMYKGGKVEVALELFEEAHALLPVAKIEYSIGLCLMKLERWGQALELWQRLKGEPSLVKVAGKIEGFMGECQAQLGGFALRRLPEGARVSVDGAPAAAGQHEWDGLTRGAYRVEVTVEGFEPWSRLITVTPKERAEVVVTLEPLVSEPARAATAATDPPPPPPKETAPPLRRPARGRARAIWGWSVTGVAVAALGTSGYFLWRMSDQRADALSRYEAYEADPSDTTYAPARAAMDDSRTSALVGYALGGVGVAALGTGAWLLLTGGEARVALTPAWTPGGGALVLSGGW